MIRLELPFPPTSNSYYRSCVNPRAKKAMADAMKMLASRKPNIAGAIKFMKMAITIPPVVLISKKGRDYRQAIIDYSHVYNFHKKNIRGRISIRMFLHPPDNRKRDIKNYEKGLIDALTHCGLWVDDEQIDSFITVRGDIIKLGRVILEITETVKTKQEELI